MTEEKCGGVHDFGVPHAFELNDGAHRVLVQFELPLNVKHGVVLRTRQHRLRGVVAGEPVDDGAFVASVHALNTSVSVMKGDVSELLETQVHFFEVLAFQPNRSIAQVPLPHAHRLVVGMDWNFEAVRVLALQREIGRVANKRQARCVVVDHLGVVSVQRGEGYRDVFLRDAELQPEITQS